MNIKFIQVVTNNIIEYSKYSIPLNSAYCIKHGYDYIVYSKSNYRHPSWWKLRAAMDYIDSCDYLFVLDADAYINNTDKKLEDFQMEESMSFCKNELNGGELLNGGAFILKNTPQIKGLLDKWWNAGKDTKLESSPFWEQDIINSLHNSGHDCPVDEEFQKQIKVRPMRDFNSWWLDMVEGNRNPDQFVYHIMANSNDVRVSYLKTEFEKL